ncbi:MAG: hypothetical protein K2X77_12165 [Candidatus Obscuribacterales bacterium]|nr:hypothetical protein [Candidatus Obscuribacterales bacterium]
MDGNLEKTKDVRANTESNLSLVLESIKVYDPTHQESRRSHSTDIMKFVQLDQIQQKAEQIVLESMTESEAKVYRAERAEYTEKLDQYYLDYAKAISGTALSLPKYPVKPGSVVAFEAKVARTRRHLMENIEK